MVLIIPSLGRVAQRESIGLTSRGSQVQTLFRLPDSEEIEIGVVVQLVRTLACHARGHEFKSRRPRQLPNNFGPSLTIRGGLFLCLASRVL